MEFSIFLNFGGNCREAVTFYSKVFKQNEPKFLTYGEFDTSFDENVKNSENGKDLIANANLKIGNTTVSFSDMPDNFKFIQGNNLALCISFNNFEEANNIFKQLSSQGSVFVPLTKETSDYSLLVDKFKVSWQISINKN